MASPNPIIIELKDVSMIFDNKSILKNVNLKIYEEEVVFIVGPSGQGKSLLLKIMAGLVKPTSGEVFVEGQDWTNLRGAEKRALLLKMGMLFQKNALFDSLTCGENISFPLEETTRQSPQEIEQKILDLLEAVGISHAKNLYPDEISGGMQKRLGIARALALEPEIIFYDDPTAGLDPITSRKIIELIAYWQKRKKSTVMAITNDMNRAYQIAERILVVCEGEVIDAGSPEQTKSHSDPRVHQFVRGDLQGPLTEPT